MVWKRWLAWLTSMAVPLLVIVWILSDAELPVFAWMLASWSNGGSGGALCGYWFENHRSEWVPRAIAASLLMLTVLAALAWEWFVWSRLKATAAKSDRWRAVAAAFIWGLAPLLLLVGVVAFAEPMARIGLRLRIGPLVKTVEETAPKLLKDWPTEFVDFPDLGQVEAQPERPNHLVIRSPSTAPTFGDRFAHTIDRNPAGDAVVYWLSTFGFNGGARYLLYQRDADQPLDIRWLSRVHVTELTTERLADRVYLVFVE